MLSLKGPEKPSMESPIANVSNINGFRLLFLLLQASIMVEEAMAKTTLNRSFFSFLAKLLRKSV